MTDAEEEVPEHDPWDERDAYLAEGHDDDEVEVETVVDAETGEQVPLDGEGS